MSNDTSQSKRGPGETAVGGAVHEQESDAAPSATAAEGEGTVGTSDANRESVPEPEPEQPAIPAGASGQPPPIGSWLTTDLRPSPSKSLPPLAPQEPSSTSPETLAPQVMPPEPSGDDDLAVIPGLWLKRPHAGKLTAIALVTGLLLMAGATWWWKTSGPTATPVAAATAEPARGLVDEPTRTPPPTSPSDDAHPEEASGHVPSAAAHGWFSTQPGAPALEGESLPYGPGGPSVGRLPDLPAEFWSKERELEKQRGQIPSDTAESAQPLGE